MFKENYRKQNRLGQGLKYHVKMAYNKQDDTAGPCMLFESL